MKGATAEPCASTISTPSSAIMTKIGHSQYFLRTRMKAQSSLIISITAVFLELVRHRSGRRPRRLARQPVRGAAALEPAAHRVLAGKTHERAERRNDPVEQDAERDRAHHAAEKKAELQPPAVQPGEQRRSQLRHQCEGDGDTGRPPARASRAHKRPGGDDQEY